MSKVHEYAKFSNPVKYLQHYVLSGTIVATGRMWNVTIYNDWCVINVWTITFAMYARCRESSGGQSRFSLKGH